MSERTECCETCRFWESRARAGTEEESGQCRRYAPRPLSPKQLLVDENLFAQEQFPTWPATYWNEWCGEWQAKAPPPPPPPDATLSQSFDVLGLSVRSLNALENAGLRTIEDLVRHDPREYIKNFGAACLREVNEKLAPLGLKMLHRCTN